MARRIGPTHTMPAIASSTTPALTKDAGSVAVTPNSVYLITCVPHIAPTSPTTRAPAARGASRSAPTPPAAQHAR